MRDDISRQLDEVANILEVEKKILALLKKRHAQHQRVGYVSGIISSDGPDKIADNELILHEHTERLRRQHDFPIFAATDIFTEKIFAQVDAGSLTIAEWIAFWRNILHAGYVTDIFMTPRWDKSTGATDEYNTAKKLRLKIHYV